MDRRQFITSSVAASVTLGAGPSGDTTAQDAPQRVASPSAKRVLQELIDGNQRFVEGRSEHPRSSENWLKRLTKGQTPMATILACSDSRVPLELLFDQGFGDIFAIRVAGNVVTRYGIGSMEYAQHHLQTPVFMVLGHEGCGAVTAAMLPKEKRDQEPKGVRELLDLVHIGEVDPDVNSKARVDAAVEANARNSARLLRRLDPKVEGFRLQKGNLLVTAVYEISTGRVRILDANLSKTD